ncbi:hypothetical protein [Serratia quinivorans]
MRLKASVFFSIALSVLFNTNSNASEIEMKNPNICNGYHEYTGKVLNVIATTNYDGEENVYANLKYDAGKVIGGKIYYRAPYQAGYIPMINLATIASVTGVSATFCMKENGDQIYAILIKG